MGIRSQMNDTAVCKLQGAKTQTSSKYLLSNLNCNTVETASKSSGSCTSLHRGNEYGKQQDADTSQQININQIKQIHRQSFYQNLKQQSQNQSSFTNINFLHAQPLLESQNNDNEVLYEHETPKYQQQIAQGEQIEKLKQNLFNEINRQIVYHQNENRCSFNGGSIGQIHKINNRNLHSLNGNSSSGNRQIKKGCGRQKLSVYERQLLWDQSRKNKIQQLRETINMSEVQDCTFKPQLISHIVSRQTENDEVDYSNQQNAIQSITFNSNNAYDQFNHQAISNQDLNRSGIQSNQKTSKRSITRCKSSQKDSSVIEEQQLRFIEKHINRLSLAKLQKEMYYQQIDQQPGSGVHWKNKLTQPSAPNITGLSNNNSRRQSKLSLFMNQESATIQPRIDSQDKENIVDNYSTLNRKLQSTSQKRIKSLKRAISPQNSSYQSAQKRHNHYPNTSIVDKVLAGSNQKLKFYQDKVQNNAETIVDELEKAGVYHRSISTLSQSKQTQGSVVQILNNNGESFVNQYESNLGQGTLTPKPIQPIYNSQSSCCYTKQYMQIQSQQKELEDRMKRFKQKISHKQEEVVNSKIIGIIHQHIQSLDI
ncbi:UNKNOWN [Stylonychia lemnae]|uniref:Uncharacterized protein n=1 Tax=Stylonychia lemnae TaxID=5949 RepID=A0A078B9K1_STYLE|nr:UNKNOWN [Stylonychia lemnae]|eukprot:CDW90243.1 UNKNOWN [Stylonychia lemnae]